MNLGAPQDPRRRRYCLQFGLTRRQGSLLTSEMLDQLDRRLSDEARKLLLGIK